MSDRRAYRRTTHDEITVSSEDGFLDLRVRGTGADGEPIAQRVQIAPHEAPWVAEALLASVGRRRPVPSSAGSVQ